jgi:hypothetical protein
VADHAAQAGAGCGQLVGALGQLSLEQGDPAAADSSASSWACTACRFSAYAGALLIAGAIAYGVAALTPESVVVLWLATLVGISAEQTLAFIGLLAEKAVTAVPEIVTAVCRLTGACPS